VKRGFGIVEMLVVLAVLGIALGLGLPNLQSYILHSQLNQAVEEVAVLIKRVEGQALTKGESHHLKVPYTNTLSWGVDGGSDQGFTLSHGTLTACTLGGGGPCGGSLNFSGRGLPAAQYSLTVTHRGKSQKVLLLLTGKVVIPR
jgi:prepilin-type N-terminal cleavage/methylation domain-containing protein